MTDKLETIRAIWAKVTKRPLQYSWGDIGTDYSHPYSQITTADDDEIIIAEINDKYSKEEGRANGTAFAAAPEHIAWLCDEVDALRAALANAERDMGDQLQQAYTDGARSEYEAMKGQGRG